MGESISVNPAELRVASKQLDVLFTDSNTELTATDAAIAESRDGWKGEAATAFDQFNTYLQDRRTLLQKNLGELSEGLRTAASTLEAQDDSTATATTQLTAQVSSLALP